MRKIACISMAFGLMAGACGDDTDAYVGTYEVTSHTLVSGGCTNAPEPVTTDTNCFSCIVEKPFFKVKKQDFFGQKLHTIVDCDSGTVCDDAGDDPNTINLSNAFFDRNGDGGRIGTADAAATGGAGCSFTGVRLSMVTTAEGVKLMRTESKLKADAPSAALDGDDCLDLTDTPPPASEMECSSIEEIQGRSVVTAK